MSKHEVIKIDDIEYVRKDSLQNKEAEKLDNMPYVCIRSYDAGCFCGYLKSESTDGRKVELVNSRRLWYWSGAASLSQLAMDGVNNPNLCKFPCEVISEKIMNVCENIIMTEKARISITEVPVWKQ